MKSLISFDETVKTKDFNEVKAIVAELAQAQKELAEAQKRTEEEIRKLTIGLNNSRAELGGLSKTMSYTFENEAFRILPGLLKERFQIEITQRF